MTKPTKPMKKELVRFQDYSKRIMSAGPCSPHAKKSRHNTTHNQEEKNYLGF